MDTSVGRMGCGYSSACVFYKSILTYYIFSIRRVDQSRKILHVSSIMIQVIVFQFDQIPQKEWTVANFWEKNNSNWFIRWLSTHCPPCTFRNSAKAETINSWEGLLSSILFTLSRTIPTLLNRPSAWAWGTTAKESESASPEKKSLIINFTKKILLG